MNSNIKINTFVCQIKFNFLNKYINYIFSIPFAIILMLFFAISIAYATFVENDYGTIAAKALIFNSWWLELCLILLCLIFIFNIYKYKLYYPKKIPVLFLHCSFIFIIIGAGVTRYIGTEGVMRIREGSMSNQFLSSDAFLEFKIHDNISEIRGERSLLLSSVTNDNFTIPIQFNDSKIFIKGIKFTHDPTDHVVYNKLYGKDIIEIITPDSNGGMKSNYIEINSTKNINNLTISFQDDFDSDVVIEKIDSIFYVKSKYDIEFMKMSDQSKGFLENSQLHLLNHKVLYTINGTNLVFKNSFDMHSIGQISAGMKNNENVPDLMELNISINKKDTTIFLSGHKGVISPKTYIYFENLFFSLSYGSKNYTLPFAIYLKDFQLDRYPGSNSPSSFASDIQVWDGDEKINHRIFMNNVLNYRGYRFFQSSYDQDELGTILSVNQDKWGTIVTYFGYLCLLMSMVTLLISRFSRFNVLSKLINNKI